MPTTDNAAFSRLNVPDPATQAALQDVYNKLAQVQSQIPTPATPPTSVPAPVVTWTGIVLGVGWLGTGHNNFVASYSNPSQWGLVQLKGGIKKTSFTSGDRVGTIGTGSLPTRSAVISLTVKASSSYFVGWLTVASSGLVTLTGAWAPSSSVELYLDGLSYSMV